MAIGEVPQPEEFRGDWTNYTLDRLKELAQTYDIELTGARRKQEVIEKISSWLALQPYVHGERKLSTTVYDLLPRFEVFSSSEANDPDQVVNAVLKSLCREEINSDKYSGQIKQIEEGISETLSQKVAELMSADMRICP